MIGVSLKNIMLPISSFEIFDLITEDSTISDLVGIHRLRDGSTRQAIAHFWPTESIEADTIPEGVEIVVHRKMMGTASVPNETGEVAINPTFRITVTQWEPAPGDGFHQQEIIDQILMLLPGANAADVTIPNLTAGLQQYVITWTCPVLVLT